MLTGARRWTQRRSVQGVGTIVLAIFIGNAVFPDQEAPRRMAIVAMTMAMWWVLEIVPLAVTSLFPLILLPALDLVDIGDTAESYGKPTIFLFLGGFLLALGLQRSKLHRRIALAIVSTIGDRPHRLMLGFMLATAFLSMWISNTATVMVSMPIALSVLEEVAAREGDKARVATLGTALMLGIAYTADIGGMATPVGTPPNLVLMELQAKLLPEYPEIAFNQWVAMGLPFSAVFLAVGWWLLTRVIFRLDNEPLFPGRNTLLESYKALGPMRRDEWMSGGVFVVVAALWMTGADLRLGEWGSLPGWRSATGFEGLGDASVAIAGAVLLFLIPSQDRPGERILDWDFSAANVPWGLLILFGGGFALARGFQSSGLSASIGQALTALEGLPTIVIVAIVCVVLTALTELTSNTATTTLVLPILAKAGTLLGIDPRALMIPATLSASCAFMMPVASPTQAIVIGSGYVPIKEMVRAGIWFNVFGVIWVTVYFRIIAGPLFDVVI